MTASPLTDKELSLVAAAKSLLRERRRPGLNTTAAAVATTSDATYFGLNLWSPRGVNCPATAAALSAAHTAGDCEVTSTVAVAFTPDMADVMVISPSSSCRELLWQYHPDTRVVVPGNPAAKVVSVADLLPDHDLFPSNSDTQQPALPTDD